MAGVQRSGLWDFRTHRARPYQRQGATKRIAMGSMVKFAHMKIEIALMAALAAVLCSCGNSPKPQFTERVPDKAAVAVSEPVEDPDPAMRIVAQDAPCFPKYNVMLDNIALVKRLASENDEEALTTLQAKGVFVMLSAGTRFKLVNTPPWPHRNGTVKSRRFIGTVGIIESFNLIKRKGQPPDVSVQQEISDRESNMRRAAEILRKNGY
jgi:hypothetical protein